MNLVFHFYLHLFQGFRFEPNSRKESHFSDSIPYNPLALGHIVLRHASRTNDLGRNSWQQMTKQNETY